MVPLLIVASLVGADRARAGEDPDQLFRKGRFAEAEKAYADLDMDHPKDIRYRYDRGCAAYQKGDYQAAIAAFSSASLRAEDDAMRFKAAYNLGNAVFQKGDFAAAADLYRSALRYDPANQDARHNLELSLRKREQQKQDQEKKDKQDKQDQKDQKDQKGEKGDKGKKDQQEGQKGSPDKKNEADDKNQGQNQDKENAGAEKKPDPSGDLKPLKELPENAPQQDAASAPASSADRKMAEALLNNVTEDRSHLRQPGAARRRAVRSGKDW